MKILGISAFYHDAAAALISDGEIVAAAQEERFTRIKNDPDFPIHAIRYCIQEGKKISSEPIQYIAFYDQPLLMLDRYLKNILAMGKEASGIINFGFDNIFSKRLWVEKIIRTSIPEFHGKVVFVKHHVAHAASTFFPSPFEKSVILTFDGVGEWTTTSIGVGCKNHLELKKEIKYPDSLGLFYSALSYFCGFKVNSGEYKFMGLAPYGASRYYDVIKKELIDIKDDGSFKLNLQYFDFYNGGKIINEKAMERLFRGPRRLPENEIRQREADIAASTQKITEEIIVKIAKYAKECYGQDIDSVTLAGGVALNCVANGNLLRSRIFDNLWIQPAAGDAGAALGAALYLYYDKLHNPRKCDGIHDQQKGSYLGPEYNDDEIEEFLKTAGFVYEKISDDDQLISLVVDLLTKQKIIGLFRGRMEFGPRALGNRSILADPRGKDVQSRLNQKVKFRESFRPFAPIILESEVSKYYELNQSSPYMLLCAYLKKAKRIIPVQRIDTIRNTKDLIRIVNQQRSEIPAVTHIDYSSRIQTVDGVYNSWAYELLKTFRRKTGYGILVNTSFNVRGEPIVCSPKDACRCFMVSGIDVLVIGSFILFKDKQDPTTLKIQLGGYSRYDPD